MFVYLRTRTQMAVDVMDHRVCRMIPWACEQKLTIWVIIQNTLIFPYRLVNVTMQYIICNALVCCNIIFIFRQF